MLIINRAIVKTKAPVLATDNNNATTGNQSPTWIGANPSNQGVAANVAAGVGLTTVDIVQQVSNEQVISKYVRYQFAETLTAGQDNFIRVPLSSVGITDKNTVIDARITGVHNPDATNNNPSFIGVTSAQALVAVINNAVMIKIINTNQALFQNKYANIEVKYY